MPTQLTVTWAAVYLEVLVVLLVFALGFPALVLRLAVPEDLRRFVRHRWTMTLWTILTVVLALVAVSLVWFLHPCSGASLPRWQETLGGLAITVVLGLTGVFWWVQMKERSRESIIRGLERDCIRNLRRRRGLVEKPLADLIHLGKQGNAGYEKEIVLRAFGGVAASVQDRPRYAGNELVELVQGIEKTLVGGEKIGDFDNFLLAVQVLDDILSPLRTPKLSAAPDMAVALQTLERLGGASLKLGFEQATLIIVQAVAAAAEGPSGDVRLACESLLEIGRSALMDTKRFLVAVAALSRLEALAETRYPLKGEVAANLLGLLAHFWGSGRTARRHGRSVLERMGEHFEPSLQDCIKAAIECQYRTTRFDTADKLIEMLGCVQGVALPH